MNAEIYESLPTTSARVHMFAGAIAGIMEHCVMYPIDSVKTWMQMLPPRPGGGGGMREILSRMVRQEGLLRPVRGMSVIVVGAGPAHALYFSCYESVKNKFMSARLHSEFNVFVYAFAGVMATVLHDGIMNPVEVVKQRLQMYNSPYRNVLSCIINVYKREGASAFYRSYTTQLAMNVPFQSIHFVTYEVSQSIINPNHNYNSAAHMLSGAIAGAVAAAATTPLDVCKTLLNTQQNGIQAVGMLDAFRKVYIFGGLRGYFRGLYARVLYQTPATAICWTTYESFKYILRNQDDGRTGSESDDDSTTMSQNQSASSRSNCLESVPLQFNVNY